MTDEQLQQIRERLEVLTAYLVGQRDDVGNAAYEIITAYRDDMPALLADVKRQREIVQAVAAFDTVAFGESDGAYKCHWCERSYTMSSDTEEHAPDCPVTKARAILAISQQDGD